MKTAMSPLVVLVLVLCFASCSHLSRGQAADKPNAIHSSRVSINVSCGRGCLWSYRADSDPAEIRFAPPEFSIDGQRVVANGADFKNAGTPVKLANGVTQYGVESPIASDRSLHLRIDFR